MMMRVQCTEKYPEVRNFFKRRWQYYGGVSAGRAFKDYSFVYTREILRVIYRDFASIQKKTFQDE